jgi:hypothetical protein
MLEREDYLALSFAVADATAHQVGIIDRLKQDDNPRNRETIHKREEQLRSYDRLRGLLSEILKERHRKCESCGELCAGRFCGSNCSDAYYAKLDRVGELPIVKDRRPSQRRWPE